MPQCTISVQMVAMLVDLIMATAMIRHLFDTLRCLVPNARKRPTHVSTPRRSLLCLKTLGTLRPTRRWRIGWNQLLGSSG